SDSFQSDIFPPALSIEPSLSAAEFFSGKQAPRNLVNLDSGKTFAAAGQPSSASTPAPTPTAPPAQLPVSVPTQPPPAAVPPPATVSKSLSAPPAQAASAPDPVQPKSEPARFSSGDGDETLDLRQENAQLKSELREARELIRNLELQVEVQRANARKAAQALMDAA
ncbi:hypothetical protein MPER_06789, partial [Moniliophthora perniciosa FA553]